MFETYLPRVRYNNHIRFRKDAGVYISAGLTAKYFNGVSQIRVAFDKDKNILQLTPTNELLNTLKLSKTLMGRGCAALQFGGRGFVDYFKLEYVKGKSYIPQWDDNDKSLKINIERRKR